MNAVLSPATLAKPAVRNAVEVEHISKHFGKLAVLEDISLTAPSGSVLAIVGASGCGKSTLLNIIAGLTQADQGNVRIDGVAGGAAQCNRAGGHNVQGERVG